MLIVVALAFPVLLLFVMLGMERVERPLEVHDTRLALERFLDAAELDVRPDEVETFVAEGYSKALDRYWGRRRRRQRRVLSGSIRPAVRRPTPPAGSDPGVAPPGVAPPDIAPGR